jgi:hypothetical protein
MNTTINKCEECSMCCKLPHFDAINHTKKDFEKIIKKFSADPTNSLWRKAYLKKPFEWCFHCSTHKSCDIWKDRPTECIDFECMYLQNKDMGEEWYPKNAGFYVEIKKKRIPCMFGLNHTVNIRYSGKNLISPFSTKKLTTNGIFTYLRKGANSYITLPLGRRKYLQELGRKE